MNLNATADVVARKYHLGSGIGLQVAQGVRSLYTFTARACA